MPALTLQTEAFVLLRQPPAESFQTCTLFSGEHGVLTALQRIPRKPGANNLLLDLFDEAAVALESSNQGRTWFIRETRLIRRASGIGRSYEALRAAGDFAAIVVRNPVGAESRQKVAELLRAAFAALSGPADPELIYFKSLFRFSRDEGYALNQQWLPSLPADLRRAAERLLRTPVAELDSAAETAQLSVLRRHLEDYLRGYTDIAL